MEKNLVNYDTQWTNEYIKPDQFFHFPAYMPIETILSTLECEMKKRFPGSKQNYQTPSARLNFNRLYRNLIPHHKGWQVLYREPNSKKDYAPISDKIGYKPKTKKISLQLTVLRKPMLWTHELYPLIDQVKIENAANCEIIAQQLNQKIENLDYEMVFQKLQPYFSDLSESYAATNKINSNGQNYDKNTCLIFFNHLKIMYNSAEPIITLMNNPKKYRVRGFNINDILQKKNTQTAKGWRVKFLDIRV